MKEHELIVDLLTLTLADSSQLPLAWRFRHPSRPPFRSPLRSEEARHIFFLVSRVSGIRSGEPDCRWLNVDLNDHSGGEGYCALWVSICFPYLRAAERSEGLIKTDELGAIAEPFT